MFHNNQIVRKLSNHSQSQSKIYHDDASSTNQTKRISRQQFMLKGFYSKLVQKEIAQVQRENDRNLQQKIQIIKQRLKNTVNQSLEKSKVLQVMEKQDDKISLSSLLRIRDNSLDLGKKYNCKIVNKLEMIKQVTAIGKDKENYQNWMDSINNSPLKSPNFNKMNYVLQKVKDKHGLDEVFKPIDLDQICRMMHAKQTGSKSRATYKAGMVLEKIEHFPSYSPRSKIDKIISFNNHQMIYNAASKKLGFQK